jgi:hypothetical protein
MVSSWILEKLRERGLAAKRRVASGNRSVDSCGHILIAVHTES